MDENGQQSPYPVNATGIYNINITFDVLEGDDVMIEVWYEGWDDIDLYYGNQIYPSGFRVTNLVVEEEVTEEEEDLSDSTINTDETSGSGDSEVSLSLPENAISYGLIVTAVGSLIAAGVVERGARNSIPQIAEGLQKLVDAGITNSEINDALTSLQDVDGLAYFSEDRANALELLNTYESTTGDAVNSMEQLDELQNLVSELEASGVSSPDLEAEIADIESMISEQLTGDTNEEYSDNVIQNLKRK